MSISTHPTVSVDTQSAINALLNGKSVTAGKGFADYAPSLAYPPYVVHPYDVRPSFYCRTAREAVSALLAL